MQVIYVRLIQIICGLQTNSTCSNNNECASKYCSNNNKCGVLNTVRDENKTWCTNNSDCQSNICTTYTIKTKACGSNVGVACTMDTECSTVTKKCVQPKNSTCTKNTE